VSGQLQGPSGGKWRALAAHLERLEEAVGPLKLLAPDTVDAALPEHADPIR